MYMILPLVNRYFLLHILILTILQTVFNSPSTQMLQQLPQAIIHLTTYPKVFYNKLLPLLFYWYCQNNKQYILLLEFDVCMYLLLLLLQTSGKCLFLYPWVSTNDDDDDRWRKKPTLLWSCDKIIYDNVYTAHFHCIYPPASFLSLSFFGDCCDPQKGAFHKLHPTPIYIPPFHFHIINLPNQPQWMPASSSYINQCSTQCTSVI